MLDRDAGGTEQRASCRAKMPLAHMQRVQPARHDDQDPAQCDHGALDDDQRGRSGVLRTAGAPVSPRTVSPTAVTSRPIPLPAAEMKAEEPLGEDRQEHSPPRPPPARSRATPAPARPRATAMRPARRAIPPSTPSSETSPRRCGPGSARAQLALRRRRACLSRTETLPASAQPTARRRPAITRSSLCDRPRG